MPAPKLRTCARNSISDIARRHCGPGWGPETQADTAGLMLHAVYILVVPALSPGESRFAGWRSDVRPGGWRISAGHSWVGPVPQ